MHAEFFFERNSCESHGRVLPSRDEGLIGAGRSCLLFADFIETLPGSVIGRISKYFALLASRSRFSAERQALQFLFRLTNGSQWSEKGSETVRRPVSQLLTLQKTKPFVKHSPGAAVVRASGSYPYVRRKASSQRCRMEYCCAGMAFEQR